MRALYTAILYFGSFLALGWVAKRVLDKWMLHPPNAAGGAIQVDDTIAFDLEVIADLK